MRYRVERRMTKENVVGSHKCKVETSYHLCYFFHPATFKLLRGMYEVGRQLDLTRLEALPAEARRSKGYDTRRKTYVWDSYMMLLD